MYAILPRGLAYDELNLRRNPFGELDFTVRAELAVADVAPLVARLREPGFAVQFLGDKGRGKTTHLLAIARQLPEAPYVRIAETGRTPLPGGPLVLVDEVQRLGAWQRWRLFRRWRSLALGTHEDLSRRLRRAGFEVKTIRVASDLEARQLHEILNRRIVWARRGPGPIPEVTLDMVQMLLKRFGNDIRAMEHHLYHWIEDQRVFHGQV